MKNNNDDKLLKIKELLKEFTSSCFDDELQCYAMDLLETISHESGLNIFRGRIEIWAASIVYVVARLNYLFDKSSDAYLPADEICGHFVVNRSTVKNKAYQIQDHYGISIGDRRFTRPEIARSFEFLMTPEGFIIPAFPVSGIEAAEGNDLEELKKHEIERKRRKEREFKEKEARRTEKKQKIAEEKRKMRNREQLNLFDDIN
ncbi:MAG: DUF6398 domain-containing protein [Actinomycetia bacterium]|nr:DUF6398 domain-containing protein [Actinomycetes bacterium]